MLVDKVPLKQIEPQMSSFPACSMVGYKVNYPALIISCTLLILASILSVCNISCNLFRISQQVVGFAS